MKNGLSKEFLEERLASTEAVLQKTQIQADTALEYAEQVWWSWDIARKRFKIRSVGECILGYGEHDLEHGEQFWWDRMHPEDLAEVKGSLQECFSGKIEVWRCEHRLRDAADDWVWVEESGFVLRRNADGHPLEMVGTTRKVQERYQLLDLFRGSESVIEALLETAPLAFWFRDPEGVTLLASRHMKVQFGNVKGGLTEESICLPEELDSWRTAFNEALHRNSLERKIMLCQESGSPTRHAHYLIPVPLDTRPFGILEIFIPESD